MAQTGCLTYTSISGLKDSTPGQMEASESYVYLFLCIRIGLLYYFGEGQSSG